MTLLWNWGGFTSPGNDLNPNPDTSSWFSTHGLGYTATQTRSDNRANFEISLGPTGTVEQNSNTYRNTALFPTRNRIFFGFAILWENSNGNGISLISPAADTHRLLKFMDCPTPTVVEGDTDSNTQIGLGIVGSSGNFFFTRGDTIIATSTAGNLIPLRSFIYVEVDIKIDATVGWAKLRVNGVEVINFSGNTKNTANTTVNLFRFQRTGVTSVASGNNYYYINDIIVMDDTNDGTPFYQNIGSIYHGSILPNADEQQQLTRSTGTANWSLVDEFEQGQGDYNFGSAGVEDIYALVDLTGQQLIRPILAVIASARVIQHDASPTSFKITLRQSASVYESAAMIPSSGTCPAFRHRIVLPTNPNNGSAAWTASDINATRLGFKVIS